MLSRSKRLRLWIALFFLLSVLPSVAQDAQPTPTPAGIVSIQGNANIGRTQLVTMPDLQLSTGVVTWQDGNYTGRGIRVGILDQGFGTLAAFEARTQKSVTLAPWLDYETVTADPIRHGTDVMSVIHEVASGVEFYACSYFQFDAYRSCLDWMLTAGVRIINHSAGVPALPLDGSNRWAREVDRVAQDGVLWINAAGNFAGGFVEDLFTDTNGNTYHEYRGTSGIVESLAVQPIGQSYGRVLLSWEGNDTQPANAIDLDLEVIDAASNLIATSNNIQAGNVGEEALEYVQINMSQPFGIRIRTVGPVDAPVRFNLFVEFSTVPTGRSGSSIIAPADSLNALTVGALQGNLVAPYSSRGPLISGALKPDLVAPGELVLPDGQVFVGTSAAAPVVAGAAALIWEINPELSRGQLFDLIRTNLTTDDSVLPGPDNTFGLGRFYMPLPDTITNPVDSVPAPVATPTPFATAAPVQQARVFVTDEGLKLRGGPATTFPVIENMPSGTVVNVLDGPEYAQGYTWWYVESAAGNQGWSVEGADGLTTLVFLPQSAVAIPTPSIRCLLIATENAVFMRRGPGANFDDNGFLPDGQNAADGQVLGADGFVWWRMTSGLWVRSDVVSEFGDCDQLPVLP